MKTNRFILSALAISATLAFTSCDDSETGFENIEYRQVDILFDTNSQIEYGQAGEWTGCYDDQKAGSLNYQGFHFSHTASTTEYDGVTYYSWYGFCPSVSTDNEDYTASGNFTDHQWASITGGAAEGYGKPYMSCFWNTSDPVDKTPFNPINGEANGDGFYVPSVYISYEHGQPFVPFEIYVTNSSYGYYSMKNGSAFNHAFTADDWCKLHITGYNGGVKTATVDVDLAKGTDLLDTWKRVDLTTLKSVDMIVFTMSSSDSGQWGMNNAAYFCIDNPIMKVGLEQ